MVVILIRQKHTTTNEEINHCNGMLSFVKLISAKYKSRI